MWPTDEWTDETLELAAYRLLHKHNHLSAAAMDLFDEVLNAWQQTAFGIELARRNRRRRVPAYDISPQD